MKGFALRTIVIGLLLFCLAATVFAGPDTYIGDTAIYSGSSSNLRPNVLFIVDNSNAAANQSAGFAYDPDTVYDGPYNYWDVVKAGQQGTFKFDEIAGSTVDGNDDGAADDTTDADSNAVPDSFETAVGCTSNSDIIARTLYSSGTYAARGNASYPSLKNGGCDNNKAYTYALGNYLNYLQADPPGTVVKVYNSTENAYWDYRLIETHTAAADNKPGEGINWQTYWAYNGTLNTGDLWVSGTDYAVPAGAPDTSQAQIVYQALEQVVSGTRYAVNFGSMVYDDSGNKGAKIVTEVTDLADDVAFNAFLAKLPGSGQPEEEGLLSSNTARPQAEALLDAGYYFRGEALPVGGQAAMPSPMTLTCDKNYIILITNGLSNKDDDTALAAMRLTDQFGNITAGDPDGDLDGDGAEPGAYGTGGTHYLDDVAKYLYETDNNSTLDGTQRIITTAILAFQPDDELVRRAGDAAHGRGGYYNVYNANELAAVLTKVLANIVLEADTAFVAPVVPSSPENRTTSGQRIYMGFFKPISQKPWQGNLKKFGFTSEGIVGANKDSGGNYVKATNSDGSFNTGARSYWSSTEDAGNVTEGGVGEELLDRDFSTDPRKVYTYLTPANSGVTTANPTLSASQNSFDTTNADLLFDTTLDVVDATERGKLINFVRGIDAYDDDGDGDTTDKRDWLLGDILHSKPLVLNYNRYTFNATNEANGPLNNDWSYDCTDGAGLVNCNKAVLFVGTNDGMLHAFSDYDGRELWSFIPSNFLPRLKYLREPAHSYFVDNSPVVYVHDRNSDGNIDSSDGDKVILIIGTRRGGGLDTLPPDDSGTGSPVSRGAYYALDVTDPISPKFLWQIDNEVKVGSDYPFSELGEPWSMPALAKIKVGGSKKVVAFIGAGYDNNEDLRFGNVADFPTGTTATTNVSANTLDFTTGKSGGGASQVNPKGRGVYCVEIATMVADGNGKLSPDFTNSGTRIWGYTYASTASSAATHKGDPNMTFSFPSDIRLMDHDGNGYTDRLYVGDTGGNMWRFDVGDSSTANWTGKKIFASNPGKDATTDNTKGRKIFYKPALARIDYHTTALFFGTGDRAHPQNYKSPGNSTNGATIDRFYSVQDRDNDQNPDGVPSLLDEGYLVDVTLNELQREDTTADEKAVIFDQLWSDKTKYGWLIKLAAPSGVTGHEGEKLLTNPLVLGGYAFFATYSPNPTTSTDPCTPGNLGISRMYILNYRTGEAAFDLYNDLDSSDTYGENQADSANSRARVEDKDGNLKNVLRRADREVTLGGGIPTLTGVIKEGGETTISGPDGPITVYDGPKHTIIGGSGGNFPQFDVDGEGTVFPIYWMKW